ncbi:Membrane fusion protein of RND family multidrug efflux pump [Hyphomicrobium sulfonivorans]|uniref:Membrane fusion protein of RND family multidrug efflux pump n=1 Tax=Hyphomicrobium sulfonivorans TaxID=121290 RepID=A0A109BQT3_HYPSL|nr:efflux RND transporter periplasmic adaptor subunit [Hyphomicrobium sulfonivorans]KWT72965.1 Membrane fusion protein of RND family multidrug efflux pump [Hyphomicrobium sulfonivorans]
MAITIVGFSAAEFCSPAMTAEPQRVSVDVAPVVAKSIRQWDAFNGRVTAVESVEIRPRVSGYIDSIAYREGEEVRRGDLLFNIDPRPYRAAVDSAKARLERARASVLLAKLRDQRAKKLLPNNTISQDEAQSRHAIYLQSQADVLDAEAALAIAELNLDFTQVRAPVDGRAGRAMLTVGNLAIADQSLLTTVVSQDLVYVDFDPDEQSYLRYSAKASKAAANGLPVRIALANEEGYPSAGTVYFIDNQVNPTTGTIRMRARVDNAQRKFTPGLFARVELANVDEVQAVLIDEKAVLTDQDRKYVYVLAADSTAQRKDVQLGRSAEGLRIITSGLSAGDKVIIGGLQRIYASGTPVEASEIPMFVTSKVGTL